MPSAVQQTQLLLFGDDRSNGWADWLYTRVQRKLVRSTSSPYVLRSPRDKRDHRSHAGSIQLPIPFPRPPTRLFLSLGMIDFAGKRLTWSNINGRKISGLPYRNLHQGASDPPVRNAFLVPPDPQHRVIPVLAGSKIPNDSLVRLRKIEKEKKKQRRGEGMPKKGHG